jgi:hypothetical protein
VAMRKIDLYITSFEFYKTVGELENQRWISPITEYTNIVTTDHP